MCGGSILFHVTHILGLRRLPLWNPMDPCGQRRLEARKSHARSYRLFAHCSLTKASHMGHCSFPGVQEDHSDLWLGRSGPESSWQLWWLPGHSDKLHLGIQPVSWLVYGSKTHTHHPPSLFQNTHRECRIHILSNLDSQVCSDHSNWCAILPV